MMSLRKISMDLAKFVAMAKARIADMECAETRRLLGDLEDYAATLRSDVIDPALTSVEESYAEATEGMTIADMRREWSPRVL